LTLAAGVPYTCRVFGKCAAILAFLLLFARWDTAVAEHEIFYRYTVLGYVKDASSKPRPGVEVELIREKTGFSYLGRTDDAGLYVIVARLGDESVGERLRLRIGGHSTTLFARFDPANHVRERGTRVDVIGDRSIETPTAFVATLKRFLED
jgi:hypothetical protein